VAEDLVHHTAVQVAKKAADLVRHQNTSRRPKRSRTNATPVVKRGLCTGELLAAVRLVLPRELAKHAAREGDKAVKGSGIVVKATSAERLLRQHWPGPLGESASVYFAAIVEYLLAELWDLAGSATRDSGRATITPRTIQVAVLNDDELRALWGRFNICGGGVLPNIHPNLLPRRK